MDLGRLGILQLPETHATSGNAPVLLLHTAKKGVCDLIQKQITSSLFMSTVKIYTACVVSFFSGFKYTHN